MNRTTAEPAPFSASKVGRHRLGSLGLLEEDFSDETPISIGAPGSNIFREIGAMRVHVFAPFRGGLEACRAIAESVRDAIRAKSLSISGKYVLTAAASPPTPGAINDGLWNSSIVNVDYSLDILR